MKNILIVAAVLIATGTAMLAFGHYSYSTRETVLQVGPVTATADQTHTVVLPPLLGWLLIGAGAAAAGFALLRKK